jgi:glycosyltransferase involved in cell wall biosynthesis
MDADVRTVTQLSEEDLAWCDILHYSRHTMIAVDFLNKFRDKYGFKIVVDTDDWWEVGKDHPKYEWWNRSNISLQIRQHLMNADAVTCTNEVLAELVPNKNVYILPNFIAYGKGQFKYKAQKKSDRVRLLYASTIMNYANTNLIAGAMHRLTDLNIEIVIAGYKENPLFDILVKNLTADGAIPHSFTPWAESDCYMSNYVGDIGILPSKATQFNKCKSNLKLLEYAALKMPVVVSNSDPYGGFPVHYANGENQWVEQITKLVQDPELRKSSGDELYKFCKENYDLYKHANERLKVYEQIIQRSNSNGR